MDGGDTAQESRLAPLAINRAVRGLAAPMSELPLRDIDERASGAVIPWYREAFTHPERDDPYWTARDFSERLSEITAPVSFVGSWYDIFLPWMLADHAALAAAGRATGSPGCGHTCSTTAGWSQRAACGFG